MERINYNPEIWGPKAWFFIDTIILSLPENLNQELQNNIKNFLITLQILLPCEKCRHHYILYIKENIEKTDFTKKKYIIEFINRLHNIISERNKKRKYNIEEMYNYYNRQYIKSSNYDIFYLIILILIILYIIKKIQK
jgi:hypothetical protein